MHVHKYFFWLELPCFFFVFAGLSTLGPWGVWAGVEIGLSFYPCVSMKAQSSSSSTYVLTDC